MNLGEWKSAILGVLAPFGSDHCTTVVALNVSPFILVDEVALTVRMPVSVGWLNPYQNSPQLDFRCQRLFSLTQGLASGAKSVGSATIKVNASSMLNALSPSQALRVVHPVSC
jgi:hypothetical protein